MANEIPSTVEQMPAGGGVSKPSSGSYGEVKSLDDLKAALPGANPSQAQNPAPTPPMTPGGPQPPSGGGLPPALFAPTSRPDQPVSTMPLAGVAPLPSHPTDQRLTLLKAWADDPNMSDVMRRWAAAARDRIIHA